MLDHDVEHLNRLMGGQGFHIALISTTQSVKIPRTNGDKRYNEVWTRRFDGPGAKRAFDQGATVDVVTEGTSAEMAAIRVTVAAGSRLGEHDHGNSDALLLPLAGRLTLRDRDSEAQLAPGAIAFVAAGERVSVESSGESAASMVVCFAPRHSSRR